MVDLPYFAHIRPEPGKRVAWVLTVLMHVLLAMILIYGIRWQTSAPETISVDLVRYPAPTDAAKPAMPPQKVEQEAPPAPPKAEILRKEPEKPKSIKEKATQGIDAIAKFLQHEVNRTRQNRVADEAARAQAQLKANQAAAAHNRGLADYLAKIRGKIRGKIFLPPSINGNPESEFDVTQLPSGEVLSVKLKKSSGNPALDAAVERAILQSSPLPKPDDPSLFERELSIKYRPQED